MDKLIENLTKWGRKNRTLYWIIFSITLGAILHFKPWFIKLNGSDNLFLIFFETAAISGGIIKFTEWLGLDRMLARLPIIADIKIKFGVKERKVIHDFDQFLGCLKAPSLKTLLSRKDGAGYVEKLLDRAIIFEKDGRLDIRVVELAIKFGVFVRFEYNLTSLTRENFDDEVTKVETILRQKGKYQDAWAYSLNPSISRCLDIREYGFFWQRHRVVANFYFFLMHFPLVFLFWKS